MSTQLKKYLLSGARDVPKSGPQEGSNLALALRRHAHAISKSNSRNRLSLDLESKYGPSSYGTSRTTAVTPTGGSGAIPGVKYRGAVTDLSSVNNRRSLDLDNIVKPIPQRRRTVTFDTPERDSPARTSIPQYHYGNDPDYAMNFDTPADRASRSRRRRREELSRDDSLDPVGLEDTSGVSPQLAKLVAITPTSYAEAQRMKKMLKRAVSGPGATFEDLKLYRTAMKRLRQIVKEEQEREIEMANEELSSTSNYGTSRYGNTSAPGTVGANYLSVLKRDRSGSRDAGGYGSGYGSGSDYGKSGYSSGTGSRPFTSRFGSNSKGVSELANKFGSTTSSPKVDPPTSTTRSRTNDSTVSKLDTSTTDTPRRRVRDSTNSNTSATNSYQNSTLPRTRTRDSNSTLNTTFESPSTYKPNISRLNSYDRTDTSKLDRSGYNSGYGSDAKSGYGSDYRSGYTSGSNYNKYQSYSRSNSTLKDGDTSYKPSFNRENSGFKPYSRENSYLDSDTGRGANWRSRVYGTEASENNKTNDASNNVNGQQNTSNSNNKGSLDTSVFRDAIDKLTKAAKDDTSPQDKKPDGVSPNAIRVLPPLFGTAESPLKNKAPADFTSASEESDVEDTKEENKVVESTRRTRNQEKKEPSPPAAPARPFRHLAAVAPLPSRPISTSSLAATPTFKLSSRYATTNTDNLPATGAPSKWLREKEEKEESRSPSPVPNRNSSAANKDCRKSVLNMDLRPADQELMRKQQEEKREELRRLRRQRGEDSKSPYASKPPDGSSGRLRPTTLDIKPNSLVAEEESESSEEESKSEKPPVPPSSVEKTASKSRLVERKHSKGKGDGLRSSSSFRRTRERQSSQNSKTSSSSSSDSENEKDKLPRSRNSSFSRRRRGSRDETMASSGDSRPSSRIRTESGRRSRNNSESISKNNSRANILKSHSGEKSRSNSRSNIIGDSKLSLGPEIDIGETTTYTFTIGKKAPISDVNKSGSLTRTKPTPAQADSSSSEDDSSESTQSSDSAEEEGKFFSLSKSKSMKKSRSSFGKLPAAMKNAARIEDLGARTSPDGKEHVSRNNSSSNVLYENGLDGVVSAKVTIPLAKSSTLQHSASKDALVNGDLSKSASKSMVQQEPRTDGYDDFQWPTGSPELPRKKIEAAIAENNGYSEFTWPSKSPDMVPNENENGLAADGYNEFAWPDGSPPLQRKNPPSGTTNGGYEEFQWPDGSPTLPRKRNVLKPQWDTETETEMTEMEWEEGSPKTNRRKMPQVVEEAEEEFNFEWPSSPEQSRRPNFMTQYSGYDTQNEMENFDWSSSPDLPVYKNANFVSQTQNIDELIEDTQKVEDTFDKLEKLFGFIDAEEAEKDASNKTSRRSSKCSEKGLTDITTDDNKDEEDEDEEEEEEDTKETEEETDTKDDEESAPIAETNKEHTRSRESLKNRARNNLSVFLGKLTNIDDIVSTVLKPLTSLPATIKKKTSPHLNRKRKAEGEDSAKQQDTDADVGPIDEDNDSSVEEIDASQVKVHDAQANRAELQEHIEEIDVSAVIVREKEKREALRAEIIQAVKEGLDDASLQVYRDGDYCTNLDLDTPLAQQAEDIDSITDSKKNAIILRTQLSVRVHAIIEKLNNSEGRELRRALFSLKQIFQDDKDLVHAFVQNDGLTCLVKVGTSADQNYQNYILRALGQVMLYVDGMNGVAEHPETVQWLYSLIGSKYRLVVKTALKLLLVFVEYTESNSIVLVRAIENVDLSKGQQPWSTIMRLLEGVDGLDMELQTYAMTLINKTLNGIPDQDNYYDQTDWLEELGMEILVQKFLHNPNSDLDLLQQLTIYEAVLTYEDGDDECRTRTIDPTIRQAPRSSTVDRDSLDRRKSRRHAGSPVPVKKITLKTPAQLKVPKRDDRHKSSSDEEQQHHFTPIGGGLPVDDLGGIKHADDGLTPALRRRRERAQRQRNFLNDQESRRGSQSSDNNSSVEEESKDCEVHGLNQQATWMFEMLYGKSRKEDDAAGRRESLTNIEGIASRISSLTEKENVDNSTSKKTPIEIKAAASVRELTEKMQKGITLTVAEQEKLARLGDITGRITKAKEDLDKAQSKPESKEPSQPEPPKKSENDIQWENLMKHLNRNLELGDLDFTDLTEDDDVDIMSVANALKNVPPPPPPPPAFGGAPNIPPPPPAMNGIPPPPPPMAGIPPPPPAPSMDGLIPPPPPPALEAPTDGSPPPPGADGSIPPAPPLLGSYGQHLAPKPGHPFGVGLAPIVQPKKTKKTIKLFWNEVTKDPNRQVGVPTIWDEVQNVELDTNRLEHLFESRAKDINAKERQQDQKGVKELVVLDPKRSNVINIGMTKLPPPRTIKTAILKMDSSIINREGIEKLLLTMLPSPEEKQKIQEAAIANPEVPLGSAEQFLMMLSTISELPARLKLWLFKLDYDNMEREVAEPLMDLKQGVADLQNNKTFKSLLSILLSMGNFLNSSDARGFQIEYLSKVPEVKDTVHKHSLLHHLCHIAIEKFTDTTDLYSEVGAITRASKVDFDELASNIEKMESECKASWDYLKVIAKHDGPTQMKLKMSEFLADCAERIIVLGIIYRRVLHRFQRFMTFLGTPAHKAKEVKAREVCGVISEFALEYRTCRERVQQQLQKKANHRERNKTRGKMIMEMDKFKPKPKTKEEKADSDLRQLLNVANAAENDGIRGKNTWRRTKEGTRHRNSKNADDALTAEMLLMADGDDALLDSLVKTATQAPQARAAPRDRKRSRHADRKSSAAVKKSRTRERVLIQELEALHAQQ